MLGAYHRIGHLLAIWPLTLLARYLNFLVCWPVGAVALWPCGPAALWGPVGSCGPVGPCGPVALRPFGLVALQPCGPVALWPYGPFTQCCPVTLGTP